MVVVRSAKLVPLLMRSLAWVALCATISFATRSYAESKLQLSYGAEAETARVGNPAITTSPTDIDVPLRLEYELITHIEHMTQTTQELRSIVEALPGPGLPANKTVSPAPIRYPVPLDETLARLNHVEQLLADITRIIQDMPLARSTTAATAPAGAAIPDRTVPVPPAPKPAAEPTPLASTPVPATVLRTAALLIGSLLATGMAVYLRRRFLRKRPSRKDLAARIESPPLSDEALELADVMSSIGLADGAAQALVEHIRTNPRQSLSHWLRLLDVYRQTGKQTEFEKAAAEMRNAFNVEPGTWNDNAKDDERNTSLENYPHISAELKKLWPTPECSEYLLSLLADNRDGKRAGFPLPVVEEIVLLLAVLRAEES